MGNKLLLADDSITIQKVVGIIFANDEYDLTIVDNGTAALEKASATMPDVMLVDAIMPGKTGYEVSQSIRNDPKLRHTPILLLTGAFEPFDENQAKSSGIDDYIAKPFESQHLIEKVQKLLLLGKERAAAPSSSTAVPEPAGIPAAADVWQDLEAEPAKPAASASSLENFSFAEEPEAFTVEMTEEPVPASPADDLWGAFEVEEVSEGEEADIAVVEVEEAAPSVVAAESDPFSFSMEDDAAPAEMAPAAGTTSLPAAEGAWHEEEAFSFAMEEDVTPTEAVTPDSDLEVSANVGAWQEEEAFSFAEEPDAASAPAIGEEFSIEGFSDEPEPAPEAVAPAAAASAEPAAANITAPASSVSGAMTLSEDQLAAIVSKISRDLIEKIAWEVVPDLAEALIKEEIRKIKEDR